MGRLDPVIKSSIVPISFFGKHLLRKFTQSDDSESRPGNPISERRTARETAPALSPPRFPRLRPLAEIRKVGPRKIALLGNANGSVDREGCRARHIAP